MDQNNFFKKLTRFVQKKGFRRNVPADKPMSQTGIGNYPGSVLGTNRLAMSIYEQNLQANADRIGRLRDYDLMDFTPIPSSALNVIADDTCSYNEEGKILTIESNSDKITKELEYFFTDIINIEFNIYHWIRTLVKYGDSFQLMSVEPKKGVCGIISLPTAEIERDEAFDGDPNSIRFRWLSQIGDYYQDYQIAHFRLIGDDGFLPYGRSILESGRRTWKQLQLLEDAMLIYRISRASEKRVFHIETGNLSPDQIPGFLEEQRSRIKTETLVNPSTGEIDLRYRSSAITDDFWFAKRGEMSSTIEVLQGGQRIGDIEDIEYIKQQLITSIGVPKIYLQFDEELGSRSSASKEDIRFSRTVQRIQKIVTSELKKMAMIHLYSLQKYDIKNIINFDLKLYNPSTIMELGKLELIEKRFTIYNQSVNEANAISATKGKRDILHMTDVEIDDDSKQMIKDKKKEANLKRIEEGGMEQSENETQPEKSAVDNQFDDSNDSLGDESDSEFKLDPSIGRNNSIKQGTPSEFQTSSKDDFKIENRKILHKFETNKKLIDFLGFDKTIK